MIHPHLTRAINRFTRAAIGLKKNREKDAIAAAHLSAVRGFFQEQAHMVLFRFELAMRDQFPETQAAPVSFRQMGAKHPYSTEALKKWGELWDGIEYETTPLLQQAVTAIEADALQKGADQLRAQLGFDAKRTFSLANPRAVAFFRKTGGSVDYIRDIQETTKESLKTVITTGLDEGWSYSQTAREIRKLYDGPITVKRAQLIATHEAAQAYEYGNFAFGKSIEDDGIIMRKRWVTSHDDRVSDGCQENEDAGAIPLDEDFPSGDQTPPRFPGCRCYCAYEQEKP